MGAARITVLVVAVAAAAIAAILMRNVLSQNAGGAPTVQLARDTSNMVKVLVAAKDMDRGARIDAGAVRLQDWPETAVGPGFITGADAKSSVDGAIVRRFMAEGEPLALVKIVKPDGGQFMSALLEPGMRAVSIAVNATSGAAGFILPGDRVDLIVTREVSTFNGARNSDIVVAETFLSNIKVLAIDAAFAGEESVPNIAGKTVTLEVTQREAEMLLRAKASGDLALSLRSLDAVADGDKIVAKSEKTGIRVTRYGQTTKTASKGM